MALRALGIGTSMPSSLPRWMRTVLDIRPGSSGSWKSHSGSRCRIFGWCTLAGAGRMQTSCVHICDPVTALQSRLCCSKSRICRWFITCSTLSGSSFERTIRGLLEGKLGEAVSAAADYAADAIAPSTRATYIRDWDVFATWCRGAGHRCQCFANPPRAGRRLHRQPCRDDRQERLAWTPGRHRLPPSTARA